MGPPSGSPPADRGRTAANREPELRVSVVVPVYDAERFLREAVRSCLEQPEVGEIVLVEDGSRDGSLAVARELEAQSDRVRVVQHPDARNHGIAASRNLGIEVARCDWLAFLDADDRYLPGRFAPAAERLAADPGLDGVYDAVGTTFEDPALRAEWEARGQPHFLTVRARVAPEALFETLVSGEHGWFHTDGILVRRRLVRELGGFDESMPIAEDTALWMRLAAVGRLAPGSLEAPVAERRAHRGSTTNAIHSDYGHYHRRLWQDLLVWGRANGLDSRSRQAVLGRLVHHRMSEIPRTGPVSRRLRQLAVAAAVAARHPSALANRTWWWWTGWSLGVPQVVERLSRGRLRGRYRRADRRG